jgi:signal transduction histidine kinase
MNTRTFTKLLKKPKDLRPLIRVLVPLVTIALVVWAVLFYRRVTHEIEQRYSDKQIHLARSTAVRYGQAFHEVRSFLRMAGNMDVVTQGGELGKEALTTIVAQLRVHGALQACLVDGSGRVRLATGQTTRLQALFGARPACSARGEMCVAGPVPSNLSSEGLIMLAMISSPRAGRESSGSTVVLVLDWGTYRLLLKEVAQLSKGSFAWVQDHRGRLIFHPTHRAQLGFDTQREAPACLRCHQSFELNRRMVRERQGLGEVRLKGKEVRVAAFAPFRVGADSWSVAVGTERLVSGESRISLIAIVLFAGIFVVVLLGGALLLDREASRRIKDVTSFNRHLELKVAERTREVQQLYGRFAALQSRHTRLERLAVAGEMVSIVAHEVRTPLNALSINAQLISRMLRRDIEKNRDKALKALTTLEGEIERINKLLEEHLLSLVRQRPTNLKSICLNDLVIDCIRFMGPEARRQEIKLTSDLTRRLPHVLADEAKLRQILINIIINAIQAMPSGGTIHLKTWEAEKEAEKRMLALSIRDTGPGIPEDDLDKIFRPFTTTKEDGTGLGLAICARLVNQMKGQINVDSKEGDGACFEIQLKIDPDSSHPCP